MSGKTRKSWMRGTRLVDFTEDRAEAGGEGVAFLGEEGMAGLGALESAFGET